MRARAYPRTTSTRWRCRSDSGTRRSRGSNRGRARCRSPRRRCTTRLRAPQQPGDRDARREPAHPYAGDHREHRKHRDRADVLARSRTRNKPFGVVPGDGNTIDSNVNAPRTIAVGMCERPVRSHRTNTATTPSAAMTTIRASSAPRSERTKPQLGRAGFDGRGAGAGAGGLVTEPFVCVCTRERGRRTRRSCRAGASSPCSRRHRGS